MNIKLYIHGYVCIGMKIKLYHISFDHINWELVQNKNKKLNINVKLRCMNYRDTTVIRNTEMFTMELLNV